MPMLRMLLVLYEGKPPLVTSSESEVGKRPMSPTKPNRVPSPFGEPTIASYSPFASSCVACTRVSMISFITVGVTAAARIPITAMMTTSSRRVKPRAILI